VLQGPAITLAVATAPFTVGSEGGGDAGEARAVVLVLVPDRLSVARQELAPAVTRALKDPARTRHLLDAGSVEAIRGLKELMDTEVQRTVLVADALVPVQYRVYPHTPVPEVVDLMVRRGVHAVPVVGEQYEVLGILTSGDALAHLLSVGRKKDPEGEGGREAPEALARDCMTRTVLCVSEEQSLTEAANMMVNRDVEQLPVVREGELVGFVTRDSILRALHGSLQPDKETNGEEGSESTS
ncbi:MAG: CBS domain-containing protein, partial [Gemmatimonadota bacterium]|jgi:CBS domain-containing protein